MVGDNIYHFDLATKTWRQADSHHSKADGTVNAHNLRVDTKSDKVLISNHYFYFGTEAPMVPEQILDSMKYRNGRNYRVYDQQNCSALLDWLQLSYGKSLNLVSGDPFDFQRSEKRYSAGDNRIN